MQLFSGSPLGYTVFNGATAFVANQLLCGADWVNLARDDCSIQTTTLWGEQEVCQIGAPKDVTSNTVCSCTFGEYLYIPPDGNLSGNGTVL